MPATGHGSFRWRDSTLSQDPIACCTLSLHPKVGLTEYYPIWYIKRVLSMAFDGTVLRGCGPPDILSPRK